VLQVRNFDELVSSQLAHVGCPPHHSDLTHYDPNFSSPVSSKSEKPGIHHIDNSVIAMQPPIKAVPAGDANCEAQGQARNIYGLSSRSTNHSSAGCRAATEQGGNACRRCKSPAGQAQNKGGNRLDAVFWSKRVPARLIGRSQQAYGLWNRLGTSSASLRRE
jgi:hypothetical protein